MIAPPRESATKAVQACQSAGIQVKMIIGDHAITAQAIARRMGINKNGAINSLIAGRIFYMLSISKLVPNLIAKMDGTMQENVDIPAIGFGSIGAIILQIIFAHVPLINQVFYTAPLTFNQWLICLAVGSPMIL